MGSGHVRVRLLGRFAVSRDGEEVPLGAFGGRLSRRLVRFLVCRDGDLVPRDVLIDALWGEQPPADPGANLNVVVNRARHVVGHAIRTGPGGYRLDPTACEVDSREFLAAVGEAVARLRDRTAPAEISAAFDRALTLWTGDPLPEDLYEPWAEGPRRRLLTAHLEALEGGATAALAGRDPARAVELARTACEREPLRERPHLLLARALRAAGDRPGALQVLRDLSARTVAELGLEPSPAVVQLQAALLTDGTPPVTPVDRPSPPPATTARPTPPGLPFVDRDDLARLEASLMSSPPEPIVITGSSGSGKSRLLAELASRTPSPLSVRAHIAERDRDGSLLRDVVRAAVALGPDGLDPLHPRIRAALATLAPELGDDPTGRAIDPPSLRSLLTEGIVDLLGTVARRGAVLLVDDLQWGDPSSLESLAAAVGRLPELPVAVAHRPDATSHGGAVDRFLTHLHSAADAVCELRLERFSEAELHDVAGSPLPQVLTMHTDGSPFAVNLAVVELRGADLVEFLPDGRLVPRGDATEEELVAAVRKGHERTIRSRLDRQPAARRELLEVICLFGRSASGRLLASAAGRDIDATLTDLDALTRGGLVEPTSRGWTVAHHLTAGTVVAAIDPLRRRQVHAQVAAALREVDADPGEIARHLEGGHDPAAAAPVHARAAAERLGRAATEEAARHAAAGLQLGPRGSLRRELLRLHAEAVAARGGLVLAREQLREALRDAVDGPERADLLTRLATMSLGADDLNRAEELAMRSLLEAGDDPAARARALAVAAVVDMNQRRTDRSRERSDEALALYRSLGDAAGVATILDARAMAGFLDGDVRGSIDAFHRVACAFEDTGQLLRAITPRSTRGHALVFAGRPDDGLADIEEAAELADALGQAEGRAYTAWHRSEALTALGRADEAVVSAEAALAIATRIGHRGWTATAHLASGLARDASGDDAGAVRAYRTALELSAPVPLFHAWAAARLARTYLRQGRLDDAASLVRLATERAPALGAYEARLAQVELFVARGDPGVGDLLHDALTRARDAGHLASAAELAGLARRHGLPVPS